MCNTAKTSANIFAMHKATAEQKTTLAIIIDELVVDSYGQNGSSWAKDADGLGVVETTDCGTVIEWWAAKCECGHIDVHQSEFSEDCTCMGCNRTMNIQDRRMNRYLGFKPSFIWKY